MMTSAKQKEESGKRKIMFLGVMLLSFFNKKCVTIPISHTPSPAETTPPQKKI